MTSLSLTPAPAPAPGSTTLLTTLKSFLTAQQTRHSLSSELEAALSTYLLASSSLPAPPSPLPSGQLPDILSAPSTCASEAIRPPNEAELGECLRIGFVGLMDIKTEMDVLVSVLRDVWNREDLAKVVERVEEGEVERLKETLKRDQLRRLAVLEPGESFEKAIAEADKRRQELAMMISEESREISAEIAELSAMEEDE